MSDVITGCTKCGRKAQWLAFTDDPNEALCSHCVYGVCHDCAHPWSEHPLVNGVPICLGDRA